MKFSLTGLAFLVLIRPFNVAAQEPVEVRFNAATYDTQLSHDVAALATEFDGIQRPQRQLTENRFWMFVEANSDNQRFATAQATYTSPQGKSFRVLVVPCSDSKLFERFIASEVARNPNTTQSGTENRVTLATPETKTPIPNGVLTKHASRNHYVFDSGFLVLVGELETLDLDLSPMSSMMKRANGWDTLLIIRPGSASRLAREHYIQKNVGLLSVLMQARDDEDIATHASRRAWLDLKREFYNLLVNDTEEISWGVKMARPDKKHQVTIELKAEIGSNLAELMRDLIPRKSKLGDTNWANCAGQGCVRFLCPDQVREALLLELVEHQANVSPHVFGACERTIQSGHLELQVAIRRDRAGFPAMSSKLFLDTPELPSVDLRNLFGDSIREESGFAVFDAAAYLHRDFPFAVQLFAKANENSFTVNAEAVTKSGVGILGDDFVEDPEDHDASAFRSGRLVDLTLDIRDLVDVENPQPLSDLFLLAERQYFRNRIRAAARSMSWLTIERMLPDPIDFRTRLPVNGDWSIQLTVDSVPSERMLRLNLTVGSQAYGAYYAIMSRPLKH